MITTIGIARIWTRQTALKKEVLPLNTFEELSRKLELIAFYRKMQSKLHYLSISPKPVPLSTKI
ncbi:MAG: hypothetical protein ACTSWN_15885 [Promethearchaeota archaeon]